MDKMSFYRFLMTLRDSNEHDEFAKFANDAFYDQSFPKQAIDYETLSNYLELNAEYLTSMTIFDEVWQQYLNKIN